MTGPLQVLTVTEHDNGHFDARVDEWYPGADEPLSDSLVDVAIDPDSLPLTDEIAYLQNLAEGLHEDHEQYTDAMYAADYDGGMDFEAWQRNSGDRVPITFAERHASTGIARSFGPTSPATLGVRWTGAL